MKNNSINNYRSSGEVVSQPKPVVQASTELESVVKQWTAENLGSGGVEGLLRGLNKTVIEAMLESRAGSSSGS